MHPLFPRLLLLAARADREARAGLQAAVTAVARQAHRSAQGALADKAIKAAGLAGAAAGVVVVAEIQPTPVRRAAGAVEFGTVGAI